jgi:hypothetical protein
MNLKECLKFVGILLIIFFSGVGFPNILGWLLLKIIG